MNQGSDFLGRYYDRFIEVKSNLRRKKLHRANQSSDFLGRSYDRYIEIKSNIRRKKLHRTNQGSKLLEDIFLKETK